MHFTQSLRRSLQQRSRAAAIRSGGREITFGELGDRVTRLAGGLLSLGLQPGGSVAILALNSPCFLEYQYAVPWAGGVLNPCNTRWSAAEIAYSLRDAGTRILIVDDHFLPHVQAIRDQAPLLEHVLHFGQMERGRGALDYEALISNSEPVPDAGRGHGDLIGIFYTGGTTGHPKGVMLSHANVMASAFSMLAEGLAAPGSVFLHIAPMFHLADLGTAMPYHLTGCTHAVAAGFSPQAMLESIEQDRVTDTVLVPTMVQRLVEFPELFAHRDLSSLRRIVYGGSPMSEAVLDRAMTLLPGVDFVQCYGMTELSPVASMLSARDHRPEGRGKNRLQSVGRASICSEIRIVDAEGREVPAGNIGEVTVRGPNVMQGYWGNEAQTLAIKRNGWIHSGDCGYMDEEGYLFIVDRMKDMIISGGENVYSAEVENVIASCDAVASCAVIGVPDAKWGERIHAVVVLKEGAALGAEELIAHCKQRIAGYKSPRSVEFRTAMPLSGAGKILKAVLREPYWERGARQIS